MTNKQLWAAVVYVLAIVLPTAGMATRYGFETTVNLSDSNEALNQLLAMGAGLVLGVTISLVGSRLLAGESENLFGFAIRALRQLNRHNVAASR